MRFRAFRAAPGDGLRVVLSWQEDKSSLVKDKGRKENMIKYANSLAFSIYSANTVFTKP